MNTTDTFDASKQKLVADLRAIVADSEELLRATASVAGDRASATRERVQATLNAAKAKLDDAEELLGERAKEAVANADEMVRDNPWAAVGIAVAVGFVLGAVLTRR